MKNKFFIIFSLFGMTISSTAFSHIHNLDALKLEKTKMLKMNDNQSHPFSGTWKGKCAGDDEYDLTLTIDQYGYEIVYDGARHSVDAIITSSYGNNPNIPNFYYHTTSTASWSEDKTTLLLEN